MWKIVVYSSLASLGRLWVGIITSEPPTMLASTNTLGLITLFRICSSRFTEAGVHEKVSGLRPPLKSPLVLQTLFQRLLYQLGLTA